MPEQTLQDLLDQTPSREAFAALAVEAGHDPMSIIKFLRTEHGVRLGDGKQLVDAALGIDRAAANRVIGLYAALALATPNDFTPEQFDDLEERTAISKRLWGMAQAGMHEDALELVERFDPETASFPEMTLDEATAAVEEHIEDWPGDFVVLTEHTEAHGFGWSFVVQTRAFAETRDLLTQAVGHGPLLVDRLTHVLWITGSAYGSAANLEATGNPFIAPDED